jgi:hypothetical protein
MLGDLTIEVTAHDALGHELETVHLAFDQTSSVITGQADLALPDSLPKAAATAKDIVVYDPRKSVRKQQAPKEPSQVAQLAHGSSRHCGKL